MVDAVDKLMTELRSACAKEQIVRSHHVIYAQEAIAALRAELEQVKQTLAVRDHESDFLKRRGDKAVSRAEAAGRLAGVRVKIGPLTHVIAEMLERAGESRPNGDILHDILAQAIPAAVAEPAGEAEPWGWATVRVEDTPDGLLIHPDDAKEWGLQDDYPYKGTFLPDGRYRIALTTPRDASAIREAGQALCDVLHILAHDSRMISGDPVIIQALKAIEEWERAALGAKP